MGVSHRLLLTHIHGMVLRIGRTRQARVAAGRSTNIEAGSKENNIAVVAVEVTTKPACLIVQAAMHIKETNRTTLTNLASSLS